MDVGSEEKKSKLEKEVKNLHQQMNLLTEEEKLESLKKREREIRKNLEEAVVAPGKEIDGLRKELRDIGDEIWLQAKGVENLRSRRDVEAEALKSALMKKRREGCEAMALKLLPHAQGLAKELSEIHRRLIVLYEVCGKNTPWRFEQVSSRIIVVKKKVLSPTGSYGFGTGKDVMKEGFDTKYAYLHRLPDLEKDGWNVFAGQDLTPDPPTLDNSIALQNSLPQIMGEIEKFSVVLSLFSHDDITEKEVFEVEKAIEQGGEAPQGG